ncbi:cGMP-dependent protein kinase, isozyme 1 isoform X2 [Chironomus tepperi]
MEKISTTPLAHCNNNKFVGISTTNTTIGGEAQMLSKNVLNMNFDVGKNVESSVDVQRPVPLRSNFKKSNTCGSFFAKCKCNNHPHHHQTVIPLLEQDDFDKEYRGGRLERNSRKTQSFSHPDTPIIFTEENRYPVTSAGDLISNNNRYKTSLETIIKAGSQKIEIKHSKRASSPELQCNGNGFDIHPEFQVQVTAKSPIIQENPVPRRPIFKKSSKSFPFPHQRSSSFRSLGDRSFSSSYSVDETSEEIELSGKVSDLLVNDKNSSSTTNVIAVEVHCSENHISNGTTENNLKSTKAQPVEKDFLQASQDFLIQSGILGPMGNVASIIKKSSRIKPMLSDPGTKDQIRKTSLVLLGQRYNELKKKRSISESYAQHPLAQDDINSITLHEEIRQLKETIQNRDDEIGRLRREIHKLKSVLHQQAIRNLKCNECNLSSLQAASGIVGTTTTTSTFNNGNQNENYYDSVKSSVTSIASMPLPLQHNNHISHHYNYHHHQQHINSLNQPNNIKKQGVSGESCDASFIGHSSDILIRKYEKDFKSKQQIKDAISDNDFLKHLDCVQVRELVESMYSRSVDAGEYVIRENEPGNHLYVSADGEFEIEVNGKVLGTLSSGKAFGELAILYNCRRTASIKAIKPYSRVWVLDRRAFQQIMMRTGLQRIEENVKFLRSVSLLKNLSEDVLCKIADVLELEFYPSDAYIIRQGARGDTFFLISQGSVKVTQRIPGSIKEEEIRTLGRGDYFGEQALIKEDKRTANIIALSPGVECLTLDRESFNQHIGDLIELHQRDYGDKDRIYAIKNLKNKQIPIIERSDFLKEYENMELSDLVSLATIGIGGFGRVLLVKHTKDTTLNVFALKQMKKVHIVETKQEEHVFNERKIMLSCADCPFVCSLYRTFRDTKYIYLLLEACLGGEVWTILRNQGRFDETTTQFIIGCVLEAFEYLHGRGIIYRDLKPENLMLTSNGYVKLVDFGFAKQIGYSTKTFTFCGTPEYVAPEIILNKGHDRAVDYWALGILISELITGTPPFTSNDPLKTYNLILKGIDAIEYPRHVSRSAISLIKKLCRDIPTDRLGYQRNGIDDIRKHKWFQGFDFENLANLTLKPPRISCVNGPLDLSNFDTFTPDYETPPDETSGWDVNF